MEEAKIEAQTGSSHRVSRFSDCEWASELKEIMLIGAGGIGSYVAYNLARIGHSLYIIDGDGVDETNVTGGQLYRNNDVGKNKAEAIMEICVQFGAISSVIPIPEMYTEECGMLPICICGLDNMKSRKEIFDAWERTLNVAENKDDFLLLDGRLGPENYQIFAIQGNNQEQINEYKEKHLFNDGDVEDLPCTAKQTSFLAMGIAFNITSILCNFLTNRKIGMDMRNVPFETRMFSPIFNYKTEEICQKAQLHTTQVQVVQS